MVYLYNTKIDARHYWKSILLEKHLLLDQSQQSDHYRCEKVYSLHRKRKQWKKKVYMKSIDNYCSKVQHYIERSRMIRTHTDCFSFDFPTPWLPHPVITLKNWTAVAEKHREKKRQQYVINFNPKLLSLLGARTKKVHSDIYNSLELCTRFLHRTYAPKSRWTFKSLNACLTCCPCRSIVITFSMLLFLYIPCTIKISII